MKDKLVTVVAAVLLSLLALTTLAQAQSPDAPPALETPPAALAAALKCPDPLANLNRDPVLLVHGTGSTAAESWSWNYALALPAAGFAYCTVDLPNSAVGDIQISAEYVVFAVRKMNTDSGRKVAIMGHSQGGMVPRWALRWWPDLRPMVSDYISLAATHHGAGAASALCNSIGCGPSVAQQVPESRFLAALNSGGVEAWSPVDYTSIFSAYDMTTTPALTAARIKSAPGVSVANILIQDICPANRADHGDALWDAVYYAVILDALLRPGPAEASRIGNSVCAPGAVPGVDLATAADQTAAALGAAGGRVVASPAGPEPALKSYAAGAIPPPRTAPLPPNTGQGFTSVDSKPSRQSQILLLGAALLLTTGGALGGSFAFKTRK